MGSPSTKLVGTPAPQSQYPGVAGSFQSMMQNLAPQASTALGGMLSGSAATPAYEAMVAASQRQTKQGEANLMENFSQMGLRDSSSAMTADVDYQSQVAKDFANILSQYTLGAQQTGLGAFMGPFSQAGMQTYAPAALVSGPSTLSQIMGGAQGAMGGLGMLKYLGLI